MIDYLLTDEQKMIRDLCKQITDEKIRPIAKITIAPKRLGINPKRDNQTSPQEPRSAVCHVDNASKVITPFQKA